MIAAIVMIVEMIWQLFVLGLRVIGLVLQLLVTILNGSVSGINLLFTAVRAILVWFSGWLGPLGSSVMWVLSPAELQRAATLAFGVAAVLWVLFSTVLNDFFYIMINPFFLNLFTAIGHFGFSIVVGLVTFVIDSFRRLLQGPTKQQIELIKTFK